VDWIDRVIGLTQVEVGSCALRGREPCGLPKKASKRCGVLLISILQPDRSEETGGGRRDATGGHRIWIRPAIESKVDTAIAQMIIVTLISIFLLHDSVVSAMRVESSSSSSSFELPLMMSRVAEGNCTPPPSQNRT